MSLLKNKEKSASLNIVISIISGIALRGISIIIAPIITRQLSPAEYGLISNYGIWLGIFSIFTGLQLGGSIQNALLKYPDELDKYMSNCAFIGLFTSLVLMLPFIIFNKQLSQLLDINSTMVYVLIPQAFGMFEVGLLSSKFISEKKPIANFILALITTIGATVVALILLFTMEDKVKGYLLGHSLPYVLIGSIIMIHFMIKGRSFVKISYWKFALSFGLPLILHTLSSTILSSCDKLMIKNFVDNASLGLYSIAISLTSIISILWSSINSALVPFLYEHFENEDTKELTSKVLNSNILITALCAGFILVVPEIIKILFPENYYESISLIPLMVLYIFFMSLYCYSGNYEFYKGKTIWLAIGTIFVGVTNILLNWLFIPRFGMQGATIASCISYFLLYIGHECIARFVVKGYKVKWYVLVPSIIFMAVVIAVYYLLENIWWARWIIGALIGCYLIFRFIKYKKIV